MNNKFRNIGQVAETVFPTAQPPIPVEFLLNGGIVLNKSSQLLDLRQSPDLNRVRIERGSLRADFGQVEVGEKTEKKIIALGEHRFVDETQAEFAKIFRLFPSDTNKAKIQSLDLENDSWVDEAESIDVTVSEASLLAWKSFFNILFFAPDTSGQVFKWDNANFENDEGNDFPAGNQIGDFFTTSTPTTVTPAGGQGDKYQVHYSLNVDGPTVNDGFVDMAVLVAGVEVATKRRVIPASTVPTNSLEFVHETISFTRPIADNTVVTLQIKEVSTFPYAGPNVPMTVDPINQKYIVQDWLGGRPTNNQIAVNFDIVGVGSASPKFYVAYTIGVWTELTPVNFAPGSGSYIVATATVTGMPLGVKLDLTSSPGFTFHATNPHWYVYNATTNVEAHGFNEATDSDESKGVTYSTLGAIKNDLSLLTYADGEPVKARSLGVFNDRVIYVGLGGDKQVVGWSTGDDPRDLEGDGSGETILRSLSDPIDELMAFEQLGSNIGALFRRRSIMRVVGTGRLEPALAFFPWIEKLGTDSPRTIVVTALGIIFLGHDKQVYLLTESGPTPIGTPIHDELIRTIDDNNLELIEGQYDPWSQDYILSVRQIAPAE